MSCGGEEVYMPTSLVRRFHGLPRFDTKLASVPATFDITWKYGEGAVSLPAVLVGIGILLLLFSLLYLCCCACRSSPTFQQRYTSGKTPGCGCYFMAFFAFLCFGGAALVYFGNEYTRSGVGGVSNTIESANNTVADGENDIKSISMNLQDASTNLGELVTVWQNADNIPVEVRKELISSTEEAQQSADSAQEQTESISNTVSRFYDISSIKGYIDQYDTYRWQGTIGVMCFICLVAILAIMGGCCKSACGLKFTAFLALFALLMGWIAAGVFFVISIVGSDVCFAPSASINTYLNDTDYAATARYIIFCGDCPNPYETDYQNARDNLNNVASNVDELHLAATRYSIPEAETIAVHLTTSLIHIDGNLSIIWSEKINCSNLNGIYLELLHATCGKVIDGAAFTFGGGAAVGLFMFFLILASQRVWTRYKFKDSFEEDEETTQLLPPGRRRHHHVTRDSLDSNPPSYSSNQHRDSRETLPLNTHLQTKGNDASNRTKEAWV